MSASSPSVIVVGAGVVGAACAEALAEAGCRVSVLEAAFPGAGATGAAMGHLVVMDDSEAQFALTAYSRRLWAERAASLPPELEHDACGTLWVAADDEELAHRTQEGGVLRGARGAGRACSTRRRFARPSRSSGRDSPAPCASRRTAWSTRRRPLGSSSIGPARAARPSSSARRSRPSSRGVSAAEAPGTRPTWS